MQLIKSPAQRQVILVLAIAILIAAGCNHKKKESAPGLPHDPLEYTPTDVPETSAHWQAEMAGEVTAGSVILQARLSKDGKVSFQDVKGRPGIGAFALCADKGFKDAFRTRWMAASAEGDYMVKTRVSGLKPATRYYYRLLSGTGVDSVRAGPTGTFKTLDPEGAGETSFVVVTGMNRFAFRAYTWKDRSEGFPALETIASSKPDFLVATGDNVYYDTPFIGRAKTLKRMRAKWHRQFATPRYAMLFGQVPVYWEKDDHDHRFNDSDSTGDDEPSHELGISTFMEQVPVVDPLAKNPVTYRTHRINRLLQIWLTEGRDYRDANLKDPGPDKTMWGAEQKAWLKRTLIESDATFKILVTPTAMVGPDDENIGGQGGIIAPLFGGALLTQGSDNRKRDNHTNPFGFKDEGEEFFSWLVESGLVGKNFYIVCGDRHWQYHSVRSDKIEEFSSGALVDGNSRLGPKPGDPMSTDPDALIDQVYAQKEKSGGFLKVSVSPPKGAKPATATFEFFDEKGARLYSVEKPAR